MKNSKQLCREVAHKLDIPEREVKEQYMFLMHQMKLHLISMQGPISIYRVGSFNVNYKKLCRNIYLTISQIRLYRDHAHKLRMHDTKRLAIVDGYFESLRNLLRERNRQAMHRVKIREYYHVKRVKRMAKQAQYAADHPEAPAPWSPIQLRSNKNKSKSLPREV